MLDKHHIPSTALLSFLASLAPPASASPLPFLCPQALSQRALPDGPTTSHYRHPRDIPAKYELGQDGLWRKKDSYSLYGSTMCHSCATATSDSSNLGSSSATAVDDIPLANDTVGILDELPVGWKPEIRQSRTSLILSLSLVVAFLVCFFIIGCLFWRKHVRRKYRAGDIEMRASRRRRTSSNSQLGEDEQAIIQQDVRKRKKVWSRATARWRANARYSIRQRRGKRPSAATLSRNSRGSTSAISIRTHHSASNSVSSLDSSSFPESDTPVVINIVSPSTDMLPESQSTSESALSHHSSSHSSEARLPPSPPAYHQPTPVVPPVHRIKSAASIRPSSSPASPADGADDEEDVFEYVDIPQGGISAAHVATDDKAVLHQLIMSASSPPEDESSEESSRLNRQESSAPVWRDEDLADFADTDTDSLEREQFQQYQLPLPPMPVSLSGKGKEVAYYYSFEREIAEVEPEEGPSAPPFEEVSSSDQFNSVFDVASAPPIEYISEAYEDDANSHQSSLDTSNREENIHGQDHDRNVPTD